MNLSSHREDYEPPLTRPAGRLAATAAMFRAERGIYVGWRPGDVRYTGIGKKYRGVKSDGIIITAVYRWGLLTISTLSQRAQ